jgi:hypothetical protein
MGVAGWRDINTATSATIAATPASAQGQIELGTSGVAARWAGPPPAVATPQDPQNRAPAASADPHAEQARPERAAPQLPQKRPLAGFPQEGHCDGLSKSGDIKVLNVEETLMRQQVTSQLGKII